VASKKPVSGLETYTMGMRRSDEKLSAAMRENEVVLIEDNYQQHYAGFDPRSPESYIIFEMINDANMLESIELAKSIQKHACKTAGRVNKGVKQDAFLVLRETSMPACLIELGYISTPSEENYLASKAGVEALGRGIYQAFVEYKGKRTGTSTVAPMPTEPAVKEEPAAKEEPAVKEEPAAKEKPAAKEEPAAIKEEPAVKDEPANPSTTSAPVFKVQFMAADRQLKDGDRQFKGLKNVECFREKNLWKYTVGSSTNYNEIRNLRKEVAQKFPQAFIVAFRNGERIDTQEAIRISKK
jgi:N-acetylmuramoyl-L-alanine amidase